MTRSDGPEEQPYPATKARGGEIVRSRGQRRYLLGVFVLLVLAALSVLVLT
ncbi:MAG: hypothetical protein ACOCYE_08440 [Pseudomonadota bacterium]